MAVNPAIAALQAQIDAAANEVDMNEGQTFTGGDFKPPAAGLVRMRFIEYIELGTFMGDYKGTPKKQDKVFLKFELSGPLHPPREDGTPQTLGFQMTYSLSEKAKFFKMFKRMNKTKQVKHIAQLLGEAFAGTITHNEKGEGETKKVYANLWDSDGNYTIRPPVVQNTDPETGLTTDITLKVEPAKLPIKAFLWDYCSKEQWDSIFIDGNFDDKTDASGAVVKKGGSKNYFQNLIRTAINFKGSPIAAILGGGDELGLEIETPERSEEDKQAVVEAKAGASADPLADGMN